MMYVFHRPCGRVYPIELASDEKAIELAKANSIVKVELWGSSKVIYDKNQKEN